MSFVPRLAVAAITMMGTIAVAGCSSDTSASPSADQPSGSSAAGGTSATGIVSGVTMTPHEMGLTVGNYGHPVPTAHDGAGATVTGKKITWHSSDASIVEAVGDTGLVRAKAVGSAYVSATIEGKSDSVRINVSAAAPPATSAAASFSLALTTYGRLAGTDTTQYQPVGGIVVTLSRIRSVTGAAVDPAVLVATLTSDAGGHASIASVPGGAYRFTATPPAGSPYAALTTTLDAPSTASVNYSMVLRR